MGDTSVSKVNIAKKDDVVIVSIFYCNLNFQGSELIFNDDFEIIFTDITPSDTGRLFIGFKGAAYTSRKINLAEQGVIFRLELTGCQIKNQARNLQVDFHGEYLLFNSCLSENDAFELKFKHLDLTVSGLNNGLFGIDKNLKINAKGIKINFPQGVEIETASITEAQFIFSPDERLEIQKGDYRVIKVNRVNFDVRIGNNCFIESLKLTGRYEFQNIISDISSIIITGSDSLILHSLKKVSSLIIRGVRLEKFTCNDCDFSKTQLQFMENSSINFVNLESVATVWNPNTITYHGFKPKANYNNSVNIPAAREFFSEFKTHFYNKGNSITAGEFYAAEMITHLQLLKKNKLSFFDRLNLRISYITSNFGQSWIQPLRLYLGTAFLFYILVLYVNGFLLHSSSLENIFNHIDLYIKILSPVEIIKADYSDLFYNCHKLQPLWQLLWLIWKIMAAYLIYQIIVASRKYLRKF